MIGLKSRGIIDVYDSEKYYTMKINEIIQKVITIYRQGEK